jgi:serine/threonine-protein kinase
MSQAPKAIAPPKVSATFEKATELEVTASAPVVPPAPGSGRTVRPPPPVPARPSRPPLRKTQHPTEPASKSTIALGDADLEPLSTLAVKPAFSIRRGIVLGGRFRVNQLIGAGAQCYVYSAEHTTLKSPVAIKCLQPQLVTPDLVDRFAREAQALTAIRNAHVAAVLDVGRAPCGTPFIVMEYLQGRDLSALLETRPRLEPRQATEILLQTCEGLAAAHALGLVHQDIKPSNIFLSDEMGIVKAKVVDFGVARVAIARTPSLRPTFTRSELDDTVGGTPFYMPPEQFFANSVIDPRSDIFSLGMVLYEMLRGTHAFDLEMSTRLPGDPVRIEPSGIDPGLFAVISRCLEQNPENRFESVAELAVALLPYAPSRSRSHAEAAAALLRKAGLSVASTMPSSIPPPMSSQSMLPEVRIPSPAPLPGPIAEAAKPSRWPLYAGVVVAASAVGFAVLHRSLSPSSSPSSIPPASTAQTSPANAANGTGAASAIAINPMTRTASAGSVGTSASPNAGNTAANTNGIAGGTTAAGGVAVLGGGPGAASGPPPSGIFARPGTGAFGAAGVKEAAKEGAKEGTKGSAKDGANAAEPGAAKPVAPSLPTGTSEDLGF